MAGNGNDDDCQFAALAQVTIEVIDAHDVTFATRSDSRTGDPEECLRRVFTVPVSEILATPIDGAPPPVALVPGAIGTLFLSRTGWQTKSHDGFSIFGADQAVFKWPVCAAIPTRFLSRLTVIPTSIVVRGHLKDETAFEDLELLGDDAAPAQDVCWNGTEYLLIQLSQSGARRLHVKSRSTTVELWPTQIIVKGSPAIDRFVAGEVDVLNRELAAGSQRFSFKMPGAPITLTLSQDGVNAFHVTPEAVIELGDATGHAAVPCHGCIEREREQRATGSRRRPRA